MIQARNEQRPYEVLGRGAETDVQGRRSQKILRVRCPFCDAHLKVYVWSLCGGGKLCDCGAKLDSSGQASKVVEQPATPEEDAS